jgi:membrane protease YdiL (CAAX protease family)
MNNAEQNALIDDNIVQSEISLPEVANSGEVQVKTGLLENARKYRTEIIITISTTCILAGVFYQSMGIRALGRAAYLSDPTVYRFLANNMNAPIPQLVFFFIIPVISLVLLREPLKKYGLRIGNWKIGLLYAFLSVALLTPLLYWAATMPSFQQYYAGKLRIGLGYLVIQYGLYMFAWEFLLRGYLYFSLEEKTGNLAIWLQSVPFAIAHLGKPAPEALTCFFGGLVLGYISMKSRSSLYAFLVHWGIFVTLLAFIAMLKQ